MRADIETALTAFILDELVDDLEEIDREEDLLADDLIDSLGMVRLVAFIEDEFGIGVPPEDFVVQNFQSIQRIIQYLRQHGTTDAAR